ncbi:MAG: helix-hairpin-helix domain-containing protein [Bacteroidales bacterium]|nr:helix-hairpin-helix domain-containing protein [Bacteroidales bacterium]
MKSSLFFIISLFLIAGNAFCQSHAQEGTRMTWEDFAEWASDGGEEESIDEEMLLQLYELHANPININEATKEDLSILPFLSEEQVEGIMKYLKHNSPMQSMGELMYVSNLGKRERDMLRLFAIVDQEALAHRQKPSLEEFLRRGKHEMAWRTDIPFYTKEGYKKQTTASDHLPNNKAYLGDRFHHSFRYAFSSNNQLMAGLQMEKDAGEKGVDYWSMYFMVRDMGIVKRAILGNYKVNFGLGLAINSGMKFGKSMMMNSVKEMGAGFSKHSSLTETGHFTGTAISFQLKHWEISAFGSHRKEDGTLNKEMTGVTSLKKDGMHRTTLEKSRKGNLGVSNWGGNIHWENNGLKLSTTIVFTHFDMPLTPQYTTPSTLYRYYNATGQNFLVGSIAYSYRYKRWLINGETAYSDNKQQNGMASLNAVRWNVNDYNTLMLIGRYYGARFVSINGKSFGENSSVQNEEGLSLGWTSRTFTNMEISTYVDVMYFPWLKHGVSNSSNGVEGMMQVEYSPNSKWSLQARYRIKSKQKDYKMNGEASPILLYKTDQNFKLQLSHILSEYITLRTMMTGVTSHFASNTDDYGILFSESIRWQNPKNHCRFDLGLTYFNTSGYNGRVYQYEPSLLYSYGSSSFYDKGIRATFVASVPMVKQSFFINTKLGITKYFNRSAIGSGLEMIDDNHREDLQVQLRWKF